MGRARNRTMPMFRLVEGLVRNGGMKKPDWLPMVHRYPPPPIPRNDRDRIPVISFPQDRLAELYVSRRNGAIDTATAMEFADEQLTLIEQGIPEEQAYEMLIEKYEKVEGNRFLSKLAQMRGIQFADPEDYDDIMEEWQNAEMKAIKEALRIEYEKRTGEKMPQ